ncbi:Na/Pi cotransporter family protein [Clostridium botulinum]|uniref:Sodium-dependent phosphate transporter n=1 Tax=Clostridium botulinum C/D str. DC5 TaxID=1443128 RepID=A0A0A0IL11_CLOBO|nr:Na/Pi cotransporter family protein [Clostridium botulinum]KEI04991.1 sodium-dependent phosphate transporter [Clostridium botulinum C/D str. BKT75002]KEI11835.1 sodium-dependent phosphate transporter [Clostridium botulinum C/D str. BKT2873]KGM93951.1 sodium-dependent phosphate transporter [Clostridium botulinum D str. CCUG 7971]KGN00932.1 sodium-dependent phosphate transporter [Clostridium botulinum C/D str. DC5]KOC46437.1 sodium-dependent phosphate transporter [Clostridium botulinum]
MDYKMIFGLLGGLGLFVYGMKLMGDGLQKAAGDKLKKILEALTSKTIFAILVGAVVAGIIQSSSATTVMTIGFVNAGLMNLFQATGVIMGANIGTTMTAQLIAFNLTDVAPLILAIGSAIVLFSKKKKTKDIGDIILGFGILFIGMSLMETSMTPLSKLPEFSNLILTIGKHPLLGVLVGLGMTATVQSSSATIGILMALVHSGSITSLAVALPILFGDNIGTCVTALLAGIGTHKNAKRASIIHLTFNTIGTIIFMAAFGLVLKIVPLFGGNLEREIANAHTLFNITNVMIQAPFIPLLVKFVNKVVPGEDTDGNALTLEYLDKRLLETPSIACGQVIKEITRMGKIAKDNLENSMCCFLNNDENLIQSVVEHENLINFLHREITDYMVCLSNTNLSEKQSELITSLFHVVSDIERIGDHADNIAELAEVKINDNLPFSDESLEDIKNMYELTKSAVDKTIFALEKFDSEAADEVIKIERNIDLLETQLRKEHVHRLNTRTCNAVSASIFVDLLTNFERVGDHSNNISQMVLEQS